MSVYRSFPEVIYNGVMSKQQQQQQQHGSLSSYLKCNPVEKLSAMPFIVLDRLG